MRYLYWLEGRMHKTIALPDTTPYVDLAFEDPEGRYGFWKENAVWNHVPLEDFPKDFQLALLFLGTDE